MDGMRKVVAVPVIPQVRNQLIKVSRASLEGPTRGKVDVADDLVDADATRDVTALIGLLPQLVRPSLGFALHG